MAWLSRCVITAVLSVAAVAAPGVVHGAPSEYVVERGDTLYGIAISMDVSLRDLLSANNLTVSSVIRPGQRLQIPGSSGGGSPATSRSYTVRAGDYLFGIASRHGVSLSSLLDANGLSVNSVIMPGQRLSVPGASGSGSSGGSWSGSYTVRAGDYLFGIASRHGVSLSSLLDANGLAVSTVIHPGQRLKVPASSGGGSGGSAPSGGGGSYTVQRGDTLFHIASRHGVSLSSLLEVNSLRATSLITPGMKLTLPAGSSQPRSTSTGISRVDRVVNYAMAQVGKPYKFFTKGPNTFDCSGLTLAAYAQVGVDLIHYSASQARQGRAVDFWNEPIRPGDLIFQSIRSSNGTIDHVAIAVSSTSMVAARNEQLGTVLYSIPPKSKITAVRRYL